MPKYSFGAGKQEQEGTFQIPETVLQVSVQDWGKGGVSYTTELKST